MTNTMARWGWTRDDAKWTAGIVLAVIFALATLTDTTVAALGLPHVLLKIVPWCRAAAFVVGIVSAQMRRSGLPSKDDAPKP